MQTLINRLFYFIYKSDNISYIIILIFSVSVILILNLIVFYFLNFISKFFKKN